MIFSEGVTNEGHALQRPKGIQLFNLCIAQAARIVLLECLAHDWQATQFSIHILRENCSHGLCYLQVPFDPKDIPHGAFASGDS